MSVARVESLADEVLQAALKVAHLERSANLAHLSRESMLGMRPIAACVETFPSDNNLENIKRFQNEICDQITIEQAIAMKDYKEAVERFKSFVEGLFKEV